MHEHLFEAAKTLNITLPNLDLAAKVTERDIGRFKALISEYWQGLQDVPSQPDVQGVDLILLGSLARQEVTAESDCDYAVLQNGCTPDISQSLLTIADRVRNELGYSQPGRQGVFGDIVIAANVYERIGLESDSNQNLTHRLLLLTESISVFSESIYETVITNVLRRYCADYLPPRRPQEGPAKVPRHLMNDLVRFWRTMAVDFGAKRWRSTKEASNLRLIKLRTTRKVLFAGPLCSLLLVPDRIKEARELPDYLRTWLKKPPLAQLASIVSDPNIAPRVSAASKEALGHVLVAYDGLFALLNERGTREALTRLDSAGQVFKEAAKTCQEIADTIQSGLEAIFFDDPVFRDRVRKYSVF